MATLTKLHDLSRFTGEHKTFAIDHIQIEGSANRIVATNGVTLISVPLDTADEIDGDILVSPSAVHDALENGDSSHHQSILRCRKPNHLTLDGKKLEVETSRPFVKYDQMLPTTPPNRIIAFTVDQLRALIEYAGDNEAETIYFGLRGEGSDAEPLNFFFRAGADDDAEAPVVSGVMAPCSIEDPDAVAKLTALSATPLVKTPKALRTQKAAAREVKEVPREPIPTPIGRDRESAMLSLGEALANIQFLELWHAQEHREAALYHLERAKHQGADRGGTLPHRVHHQLVLRLESEAALHGFEGGSSHG